MSKYVIGIDEAGRGPLAGPVAVGVVLIEADFDWGLLAGVNDSKKLSEKKREEIFEEAGRLKVASQLDYSVTMVSAKVIDRVGIVGAINLAMTRGLGKVLKDFTKPANCQVLLDGSLRAPVEFIDQETIIKGDQKERVIGLASIMAKVTRDRYMVRKSQEAIFAPYNFAKHKGYGTRTHCEAIKKHGLSTIHRKTFGHG